MIDVAMTGYGKKLTTRRLMNWTARHPWAIIQEPENWQRSAGIWQSCDLALEYSYDSTGNVSQTLLNGHVDGDGIPDLTILVFGYVNPSTDILF